jgi:hypothetical protein
MGTQPKYDEAMTQISLRMEQRQVDWLKSVSKNGDGYTCLMRTVIDSFRLALIEAAADVVPNLDDAEILFLVDLLRPGRPFGVDFFEPKTMPDTLTWASNSFYRVSQKWQDTLPGFGKLQSTIGECSRIQGLAVVYLAARFWCNPDGNHDKDVDLNEEAIRVFRTADL